MNIKVGDFVYAAVGDGYIGKVVRIIYGVIQVKDSIGLIRNHSELDIQPAHQVDVHKAKLAVSGNNVWEEE